MNTNLKLLGIYAKRGKDGERVNIFDLGMQITSDKGKNLWYPWEKLDLYICYIERTTGKLYGLIPIYRFTKYDIKLKFQNSEVINFTKFQYPELDELSNTLIQATLEPLMNRYITEIDKGSRVSIGEISIDKYRVYQGKKAVTWFDVEGAKVLNGIISV